MLMLSGVLVCITSATDLKPTNLKPATSHMDKAEKPAGISYFFLILSEPPVCWTRNFTYMLKCCKSEKTRQEILKAQLEDKEFVLCCHIQHLKLFRDVEKSHLRSVCVLSLWEWSTWCGISISLDGVRVNKWTEPQPCGSPPSISSKINTSVFAVSPTLLMGKVIQQHPLLSSLLS